MNIYYQKKRWKWLLFISALVIVTISLWYTNNLVAKIARDERQKVQMWADAIKRKASLVKYTEKLFEKLKQQERKRIELWAEANKRIFSASPEEDLTFYLMIISDNTTIPVIVTDKDKKIQDAVNVSFDKDTVTYLTGELLADYTTYDPFVINYYKDKYIYLYYKDSRLFSELKEVMDDMIESFISEVVINSASVPVIITNELQDSILHYGNIDTGMLHNKEQQKQLIQDMRGQNKPIQIELTEDRKNFIFYKNSLLLTQLRYFPYIQIIIVSLFLLASYLLFSTYRKAEQNQVWMGMAKETAHQLGTPLSSLMAWMELLKSKNDDPDMIEELNKDVSRLETIAERFSRIGSPPKLQEENLVSVIRHAVSYLRSRTSKKVDYHIHNLSQEDIILPLNAKLFAWAIENLCRNAVDAMSGKGSITIDIIQEGNTVITDITDTGKGIPKSKQKTIFNPGYSTKQGGWGLGLSLTERIIKHTHQGKIFVKRSSAQGATFRIVLNSVCL